MAKSKSKKQMSQPVKAAPIVVSEKAKGKEPARADSKPSHRSNTAVKQWISMVLNPMEAPVVRSPSANSLLASKARFILNTDIAYADTLNGYFTVVARPSAVFPLIVAKSPARFPAFGSVELALSTVALKFSTSATDAGFPDSGRALVKSSSDVVEVGIQTLPDSAILAHNGFEIYASSAYNTTVVVTNDGGADYYVQGYCIQYGSTWATFGVPTFIAKKSSAILINATSATSWAAITIAICTKAGVPANPGTDYSGLSLSASFYGFIPIASTAGSVSNFVTQKIADTASVENCRVTAMSLLVTNMGSATHDGGEIVVGDTRQSTVYSSKSTLELMQTLKALPEGNRWYSGIMRGGGYTFYVPDDMTSYEPHSYDTVNFNDNCCVAAGIIDNGGSVRVISTFVVEFYTKSQLFERSMGPTWTAEYKLAHAYIQRGRMASGNEDHESMTARIANNISKAWNWAWEHKALLEAGGEIAMALLL